MTTQKKKGPKPRARGKPTRITLPLYPREYKTIAAAAKRCGVAMAAFVRTAALTEAGE